MSARKRTALIICPGRGVYNADELGYFSHHHPDKTELMACFDTQRQAAGQVPVSELDSANRFSASTFTRGDNASALIYACSVADFLSIDRNTFEIVAVTGNSMGWYTALACAGALSVGNGFRTVNTMGTIMQEQLIGGQLIYPLTDGDWQERPQAGKQVMELVAATDGLYVSIRLGGIIVLAGTNEALRVAEAELPNVSERFPLRLPNHAAFHSPLLKPNSESAQKALSPSMFTQPAMPVIDGRGHIWSHKASDIDALRDYTFGEQITDTYDFTRAVQTGLKEFAPDRLIILGPGNTLGGVTAQSMLACNWFGMSTKTDFFHRQSTDPCLLAMGQPDQRALVTG